MVNVKTQFGAVGNGSTDDRAAIQAGIDSGWPLYFPPGRYRITGPLKYGYKPLVMRGPHAVSWDEYLGAAIMGDFPEPLLHLDDIYVSGNNTVVGEANTGNAWLLLQDLAFGNTHSLGSCVQLLTGSVAPPIHFLRCRFSGFRGLMLLGQFGALVEGCNFGGLAGALAGQIAGGSDAQAYALVCAGHSTILECQFVGCGTAAFLYGTQANFIGGRIEVCGYGIRVGGPSLTPNTWSGGDFLGNFPLTRSVICGVSMESVNRALWLHNASGAVDIRGINHQAEGGAATPDGHSEWGLLVEQASASVSLSNVAMGGLYRKAPAILKGRVNWSHSGSTQARSNRPTLGGGSTMFSQSSGNTIHHLIRFPFNPSINAAQPLEGQTVTTFSDFQLSGLKGLNIRDPNTLPKNFGGLETVTEAATTFVVTFPGSKGAGDAAFNGELSASDGGSLAAGTYFYAATLISRRGETGVNLASTSGNIVYKQITVSANQKVTMAFFGVSGDFKRRIYRGPALGEFEGFFESPFTVDDGTQPFTGRDMPPPDTFSIPAQVEADANYAVVVTPSWLTTARVTSKATTGFTIEFGTAAPAGATVQWLLFRP